MPNQCDIIIPAYNSGAAIARVLTALYQQAIPNSWLCRVIISDDGSTDRTILIARQIKPPPAWLEPIILSGRHGGVAAARNRGISASTASVILLLGADIILRPSALSAHLSWHQLHPDPRRAALGFVVWDPAIIPTPFMEWMVHGGTQNNFDDLLGRRTADPSHFFYGSHLSCKRSLLQASGFSTIYQGYGWEDLDLGRRLKARGLKLSVLPGAIGLHHHFYTARQIFRRQLSIGQNLAIYQHQHKSAPILPRPSLKYRLVYNLCYYSGIFSLLMSIVSKTSTFIASPRIFEFLISSLLYTGLKQRKNPQKSPI